uniref:Maturase n=1 Tax=Euglenaformis proxima TaxID=299110 RepID=A0A023HHV5_9EUGL|nr:maturase [Euglenaformis proxima]AGL11975.1 maturase [Euglenaformis proxima]
MSLIISESFFSRFSLFGIRIKDLRSLGKLFLPSNFLVSMSVYVLLLQISKCAKGRLKNTYSIKAYKKVLLTGFSSFSFSCIHSLSRTLSNEFITLSFLKPSERIEFLVFLKNELISTKISADNTFMGPFNNLSNDVWLISYRKNVARHLRNVFVSSSTFLTLGLPVEHVDLVYILKMGKLFYKMLGLSDKEFDFLLFKEAFFSYNKYDSCKRFFKPKTSQECLRILLFLELKNILGFETDLYFNDEVFHTLSNLTQLEYNLGFIKRFVLEFPKRPKYFEGAFNDLLIKTALTQRKLYNKKFHFFFFNYSN